MLPWYSSYNNYSNVHLDRYLYFFLFSENNRKHLHSITVFFRSIRPHNILLLKNKYSIPLAEIYYKMHSRDIMHVYLHMVRQVIFKNVIYLTAIFYTNPYLRIIMVGDCGRELNSSLTIYASLLIWLNIEVWLLKVI